MITPLCPFTTPKRSLHGAGLSLVLRRDWEAALGTVAEVSHRDWPVLGTGAGALLEASITPALLSPAHIHTCHPGDRVKHLGTVQGTPALCCHLTPPWLQGHTQSLTPGPSTPRCPGPQTPELPWPPSLGLGPSWEGDCTHLD